MLTYPAVTHQIAGNTSGATANVSSGTYVLAGGNNITLSQNGNSVTISAGAGGAATAISGIQVSNTTYTSGTVTWQNANGISFGSSGVNGVSASYTVPSTAGLLSNVNLSAGTTSNNLSAFVFSNSNRVSFGLNGSTITAQHALNFSAGTTSQNVSDQIVFSNSNNVSFGLNGSTVTATITVPAQTNQQMTMFATGNTTEASTGTSNASSLIFRGAGVASVGLSNGSVVVSVAGAGADGGVFAGVSTFGNTAGSTGTVSTGNFVLVGSNGITLSQSTGAAGSAATVTIQGYAPLSSYEPYPAQGASTQVNNLAVAQSSNVISLFPFTVVNAVSAGMMNMLFSVSFTTVGTSSGRQTAGFAMAIYTRNVSTLSSLVSNSFSWQVTGNNSSYTINQVTSTAFSGYGATGATNSAGVNITSGYTGGKLVGFPINSLLTPGVYWLGMIATGSTSSVNVGMSLSYQGAVLATVASGLAPIGSFSTSYTTGQDPAGGRWALGHGQWSSAGSVTMIPVSMNMASVSAGGNSVFPFIKFWST